MRFLLLVLVSVIIVIPIGIYLAWGLSFILTPSACFEQPESCRNDLATYLDYLPAVMISTALTTLFWWILQRKEGLNTFGKWRFWYESMIWGSLNAAIAGVVVIINSFTIEGGNALSLSMVNFVFYIFLGINVAVFMGFVLGIIPLFSPLWLWVITYMFKKLYRL